MPDSLTCGVKKFVKKKLALPKFSSEAKEAGWWDSNHKLVEGTLIEAIEKRKTQQGTAMKLERVRRDQRHPNAR
jgi:hypothetical protein